MGCGHLMKAKADLLAAAKKEPRSDVSDTPERVGRLHQCHHTTEIVESDLGAARSSEIRRSLEEPVAQHTVANWSEK